MWKIWCFLVIFAEAQHNFRSILIERACTKKPDLDFCADFITTTTSTLPPTTTTTQKLELPIPPEAPPTTKNATHEADDVDFEEDFTNSTNSLKTGEKEQLGSLVRLPKPENSENEKSQAPATSNSTETEKNVLVFVSEYCVIEREHFVKACNGDIEKEEITFCKTYPSACVSTNGVIPVISYCQRYYKFYPKHCGKQLIAHDSLQFCFAFENFCLPELHAASSAASAPAKSSLRKCEDVVAEARKVCNPFPNPKDTFNLLRCTHFLTNCKKYADWLQ
ncbi:unnamed protein product [Caenorhabditis angaria]|uniref:Uncharacterized protein n=1 Tax=Caenorhabditis angaria TaxID=860376 RepID=A0A9P1IVK7_9PELO|nr:unnamed protein product [Caenorhabditis angaria]